jgi:protein subunit release factor B
MMVRAKWFMRGNSETMWTIAARLRQGAFPSSMKENEFPDGVGMAVELEEKDLVVTTYKSTGPGGQKKNKTESAVRIKHLPTGIIVTASESRSQAANRRRALERLRERLEARQRRRKPRIPTLPGKGAAERRLAQKARHSEIKKARSRPDE